jgi:hypothetical protein
LSQVPEDEDKKRGPYDVRLLASKLRKHDHRVNDESDWCSERNKKKQKSPLVSPTCRLVLSHPLPARHGWGLSLWDRPQGDELPSSWSWGSTSVEAKWMDGADALARWQGPNVASCYYMRQEK